MNQYFADYPEMIAGKMEMVSGLYGMEAICMAEQSSPLKEQLAEGRWQRAAEEAAKQSVISDFREKTNELLHDIKGQTPEEIEQTVYAYVWAKIEEYEAQASIVDVIVAGIRCRGLEGEGADLDVIVEFAGKEREDDLLNLVCKDGLKIGDILVDINPITEGKTGTLFIYWENFMRESKV